jgi:hypothetical protein
MKTISQIWQYLASLGDAPVRPGDQIRSLESEISRLRAENRALLNSILGIAGIPPLPVTTFTPPSPAVRHSEPSTQPTRDDESLARPASSPHQPADECDSASRQSAARNGAPISPAADSPSRVATPLRRRSWHQINRILEIESARKPATSDK